MNPIHGRIHLFMDKGSSTLDIIHRIIKELEPWTPHIVYVNGQSVLTPKLGDITIEIRYVEPEFGRLMEA